MILEKGMAAPDFCLPDQQEKSVCLKDFKGKRIVLYFYPKDNTPGCTTEAQEFNALLPEFEKRNTLVMGISADSCSSHVKFALKFGLGIPLLSDQEKTVLKQYGAWQLKKLYGKESWGIVRSTFLIDQDGTLLEIWNKVKAAGHAEKVLERLQKI